MDEGGLEAREETVLVLPDSGNNDRSWRDRREGRVESWQAGGEGVGIEEHVLGPYICAPGPHGCKNAGLFPPSPGAEK